MGSDDHDDDDECAKNVTKAVQHRNNTHTNYGTPQKKQNFAAININYWKTQRRQAENRYTRHTRAMKGIQFLAQAKTKLQYYQELYPNLDLTQIQHLMDHPNPNDDNDESSDNKKLFVWTPALIENMVHAKRYYMTANVTSSTSTKRPNKENALVHFISHIPKTGVTYVAILLLGSFFSLPQYVQWKLQWQQNESSFLFQDYEFRICNLGSAGNRFATHDGQYKKVACSLWINEVPSSSTLFQHQYTLIRNPKQHVISQYFHCKESRPHRGKAHFMPDSLQEWLQAWVDRSDQTNDDVGMHGNDKRFRCYDPRNLQTVYTQFAQEERRGRIRMIDSAGGARTTSINTTTIITPNMILSDHDRIDQVRQDLQQRYDFIGLTDRTTQSFCMIAIQYTGWVPPRCDCTKEEDDDEDDVINSNSKKNKNTTISMEGTSHGVQHHGATYQTTSEEDRLLNQLTEWDQLLYQLSQEYFWKRLVEMEEEFGIRICDELRSDVDFKGQNIV